jgi:hypothetical protein
VVPITVKEVREKGDDVDIDGAPCWHCNSLLSQLTSNGKCYRMSCVTEHVKRNGTKTEMGRVLTQRAVQGTDQKEQRHGGLCDQGRTSQWHWRSLHNHVRTIVPGQNDSLMRFCTPVKSVLVSFLTMQTDQCIAQMITGSCTQTAKYLNKRWTVSTSVTSWYNIGSPLVIPFEVSETRIRKELRDEDERQAQETEEMENR